MAQVGQATAVNPEYRTQKAAGLKALKTNGFLTPAFDVYGVEHFNFESPYDRPILTVELSEKKERLEQLKTILKASIDKYHQKIYLEAAMNDLQAEITREEKLITQKQLGLFQARDFSRMVNKFVRPCPMVPRHGFVDSRPVNTVEEAEKLFEETLKAEDRAEFIVMPFIKAEYSGIWTTGKLVIGKGNDGATAGHSSRCIPALGMPGDSWGWSQALSAARITETPYVELLWAKKYEYDTSLINYFVQLRNGPALPNTVDYIPEEVEVKNIVLAEGDLLEWETKAKEFPRGTCIYHPEGSLASHYAVHAVLAKLPVLISRKPVIGETLRPNTEVYEPKLDDIRKGFVLGATHDTTFQDAAYAMVTGCHSTSVWLGRQDVLLGFAMGCAYRLTVTAALGEFRHEPGRKRKPARNIVYKGVWNKVLNSSTRTRYLKALASFANNPEWPGSFGGKKWYTFGAFASAMFNELLDGNIVKALENLNKCVNAVHNNGWAFDKFISQDVMNITAKNPSITLLGIAPMLYDVILKAESDKEVCDWFKGKHHIELEEIDEEGAKRDEMRERDKGTEPNHLHKYHKEDKIEVPLPKTDKIGDLWPTIGNATEAKFKLFSDGSFTVKYKLNGELVTACSNYLFPAEEMDHIKKIAESWKIKCK
jgi:hypothetical protein